MKTPHPCPHCGEPVPDSSPGDLCPACLLRQALSSRTIAAGECPPPAPPAAPEDIADKFPGFEIVECLGRGGMGVVYKARQKSLNRWVAIKILAPEKIGDGKFAGRFATEARTLALLNHPNIVTVFDYGETSGLYYIVMEYIDGVNLRDLLREGRLSPEQALAIVPPLCTALQYAHDKGIVHRDIKPENLLLDREGRVKIADFGIASLIGAGAETSGTPPYMAPEQYGTATVDHRADIYALGAVLYEMLTGERPGREIVAPSAKARIDPRLDEMVLRALEKEPSRRYQTAMELRTVAENLAPPAPPPFPAAAVPSTPKPRGPFARFWWLFLVMIPVGLAIGGGIGALWAYLAPKKYEAHAVVQITEPPGTTPRSHHSATWMEAMRSSKTLEGTAAKLNLSQRWMTRDDETLRILRGMVNIRKMRGTDLIEVQTRGSDRELTSTIANTLVETFMARTAEISPGTQIIVHEKSMAPRAPVSPNARLILLLASAAGLILSPLAATALILLLGRLFPPRRADPAGSARSGSA